MPEQKQTVIFAPEEAALQVGAGSVMIENHVTGLWQVRDLSGAGIAETIFGQLSRNYTQGFSGQGHNKGAHMKGNV